MGVVLSARPGRFRAGDSVVVRTDDGGPPPPHTLLHQGEAAAVVRAVSGPFLDPESRAHGGTGEPRRLLYQVEFRQDEVWAERCREDRGDLLLMDLYEQWLEAAAGSEHPPGFSTHREEAT